MTDDCRDTVLAATFTSSDATKRIAHVCYCESSVSLTLTNMTVHIPWTEVAEWQKWLAQKIESQA